MICCVIWGMGWEAVLGLRYFLPRDDVPRERCHQQLNSTRILWPVLLLNSSHYSMVPLP